MERQLVTHAAVRLRRVTLGEEADCWIADHMLNRRRFKLSKAGLLLLAGFITPQPESAVVSAVAKRTGQPTASLARFVKSLEERQLLVPPDNPQHQEIQRRSAVFYRYNWTFAWDYHLVTFDYPFVGYHNDGLGSARMVEYATAEPDKNRSKEYPDALERIPLPKPSPELLPMPVLAVWDGANEPPRTPLTARELTRLFAMGLGCTGVLRPRWPNSLPLYRKCCPSGGARHPTEGYLVNLDVPGLSPGWYHFCTADNALEFLEPEVSASQLAAMFPGAMLRAPFPVRALIILTLLFERNMYRYREPRTFRAVHIDVGHVCAFIEYMAAGLGIQCYSSYGMNEAAVEEHARLRPLTEGACVAIALG